MPHLLITVQTSLPGWPQTPSWLHPLARGLGHFLHEHQALGLFLVIFAEELGIPLPAPGDVAIAWGGYLTTTNDANTILAAGKADLCIMSVLEENIP